MSEVCILVPPPLRRFVGGETRLPVEASSVRDALNALGARSDVLREHLFDADDAPRRFVRVFVDGRAVAPAAAAATPLRDGAEVSVLVALAGG